MGHHGSGAKATAAQRAEVVRLRKAGWPIRRISAEVFGHERFRGRVERILQSRTKAPLVTPKQLEAVDLSDTTALLRQLFERRLAAWTASGEAPSMNELRNLFEVQRRLGSMEALEHVSALTRSNRGSGAEGPDDDSA